MLTSSITLLKNIFECQTVEQHTDEYEFITIYCHDDDKPFYEMVDGKMVSNGSMIDVVVKSQSYTLFVNGKCIQQGGDEMNEELMKPFFENKGVIHDGKFYPFHHADLVKPVAIIKFVNEPDKT